MCRRLRIYIIYLRVLYHIFVPLLVNSHLAGFCYKIVGIATAGPRWVGGVRVDGVYGGLEKRDEGRWKQIIYYSSATLQLFGRVIKGI